MKLYTSMETNVHHSGLTLDPTMDHFRQLLFPFVSLWVKKGQHTYCMHMITCLHTLTYKNYLL